MVLIPYTEFPSLRCGILGVGSPSGHQSWPHKSCTTFVQLQPSFPLVQLKSKQRMALPFLGGFLKLPRGGPTPYCFLSHSCYQSVPGPSTVSSAFCSGRTTTTMRSNGLNVCSKSCRKSRHALCYPPPCLLSLHPSFSSLVTTHLSPQGPMSDTGDRPLEQVFKGW